MGCLGAWSGHLERKHEERSMKQINEEIKIGDVVKTPTEKDLSLNIEFRFQFINITLHLIISNFRS